jgi:sugar porter (SP) family MFS transporter
MLSDSVSATSATSVGSAHVYKRLPSRERALTDIKVERMNSDSATVHLETSLLPGSSEPGWRRSLPHVVIATLASVLFGYHMGVVNVPLEHIGKDLLFSGHTILQGLVVSVSLASAFVGCAVSGTVADVVGRRRAFQISCIPMIFGAIISAISTHVGAMILGRFVVGLGLGLSGPVTAMYVSEISPPSVRGTYGSFLQIATCIGILAALVAGLPVHSVSGWWRTCFWIAVIPAAMLAIGMELCAESPRWLFKQGRSADAEVELERLWGSSHVKQAMADLIRNEQTQDNGSTSWRALADPRYIKVVTIGAALFAFQQFAGINAIFYFSSTVFREAGMTSDVAASVLVGVVNLFASLVAAYLMDSLGRRSLLIMSFLGMGLAMGIQAFVAAVPMFASFNASVALLGTLLYVFMFALGAGPVPALLLPEIFPDRIRAKGMAVAMCVHWVANFLVGLTFLHLLKTLGTSILYLIFAMVCITATLFVKQNVVETKGRTLEEIECMLLPTLEEVE